MNKKFILILLFIIVLSTGFLYFQSITTKKTQAAVNVNYNLSGWLWSSNIGWVSLGGSNYQVVVNSANGNLSGYAWSPNIGWIDFAPTSGFPGSPNYSAKIDFLSGAIFGWIKATQADPTNGGWDGWIKMENTIVTYSGYNNNYGKITGFAWGNLVIGWLEFYNVAIPPLINCGFSANPSSISFGERSTLSWDCTPVATSCLIDNNIEAVSIKGSKIISPSKTTNYILTCQGFGGPRDFTANITIGTGSATSTLRGLKYKEIKPTKQ